MKQYYIHDGKEQTGPYSIDQLKEMSITKETSIWKDGLTSWAKAGDLEELKELLRTTPPLFTDRSFLKSEDIPSAFMSATEKTGFRIGKFLGWTGIMIVALVVAFIIYKSNQPGYGSSSDELFGNKTPQELRAELLQQESQSPKSYIKHSGTWRKNLIGETVLEGTLTNSATLANFKDVILTVNWLSKTNTTINANSYTVYEYVGAGRSTKYKLKVLAPSGVAGIAVGINSATPN